MLPVPDPGSRVSDAAELARAMHAVIEPVNSVAYFAKEATEAWEELGLEPVAQGYFGGRGAPLGPVGPAVVGAAFYNFNPAVVAMGVPSAWDVASPTDVLAARARGMQATLEALDVPTDDVPEATELARRAMAGVSTAGRVLAAANTAVPASGMPLADLWQALHVLREYRGDGHVALLTTEGIGPVEALVLYASWEERVSRKFLQATRGWDDDTWQVAATALADRGLLDDEGLTARGRRERDALEERTDAAAAAPWRQLGEADTRRLWDLLRPIAAAAAAGYPKPPTIPTGFDESS